MSATPRHDRSTVGSTRPPSARSARNEGTSGSVASSRRPTSARSATAATPVKCKPAVDMPVDKIIYRPRGAPEPPRGTPVLEGFSKPYGRDVPDPSMDAWRRVPRDDLECNKPCLPGYTDYNSRRISQLHKSMSWNSAGYAGISSDYVRKGLKKSHTLRGVNNTTDAFCQAKNVETIRTAKEDYAKTVEGYAGRSNWQHELTGAPRGLKNNSDKGVQKASAIGFHRGFLQPTRPEGCKDLFAEKTAKRQYGAGIGMNGSSLKDVLFRWD